MKRHGNLWQHITSLDTLKGAHILAKRGKSHYASVKEVEKAIDGLAAYKGWVMRCNAKALWRKNVTRRVAAYCDDVYKTNPLKGCV